MTEITEIWPDMDAMPKWAQEAIPKGRLFHESFKRINGLREALSDIIALSEDYDGFAHANDLMSLIDDMSGVAKKALEGKEWTINV